MIKEISWVISKREMRLGQSRRAGLRRTCAGCLSLADIHMIYKREQQAKDLSLEFAERYFKYISISTSAHQSATRAISLMSMSNHTHLLLLLAVLLSLVQAREHLKSN